MVSCMEGARPWIPVILGAVGIVFLTIFWAFTGRIEPSLLALFGSLVGISEGVNAMRDLKNPKPPKLEKHKGGDK